MSTSVLRTTPPGHETDIGIFSFGQFPSQHPPGKNLTIKHATNIAGFYFSGDTSLQTLSFPNLTQIDPTGAAAGGLSVQACSSLTSLSVPLLATLGPQGDVVLVGTAIAAISLPSLVSCGTFAWGNTTTTSLSVPNLVSVAQLQPGMTTSVTNNSTFSFPALTTITGVEFNQAIVGSAEFGGTLISIPNLVHTKGTMVLGFMPNLLNIDWNNWIPTNGDQIFFSPNNTSFTSASTNLILARGVANAGYVSGEMSISGTPTGQGITDKATLQGRGVTVITN